LNSTFWAFSLIIEGSTEKALQFIMAIQSIHDKNFGFVKQNYMFEHHGKAETKKVLK
jgi:hypothetical protein